MMSSIYWILVDREQVDLNDPQGFLSSAERQKLGTMRFAKRREEWLLGRWAAKCLARSLPGLASYPAVEIEILNEPEGAPFISIPQATCPAHSLSISHSGQLAFCALTLAGGVTVGADLEQVEPRSEEFIQDYFTPGEGDLVSSCPQESRGMIATLIWSAKESMLKALGVGLRWDTRQVQVSGIDGLGEAGTSGKIWWALRVGAGENGTGEWRAWWQCRDGFVLSVAALAKEGESLACLDLVERGV